MRRLTGILILTVYPFLCLFAQNTEGVNGSIVDAESGKGIAYVTVIAENQKGKQTGSAISDNDGVFFLPLKSKGQYKLHFSQIGYGSVTKEIEYGGGVVNLPETKLTNRVIEIELTNTPLIRREADRIVYDVGSDPDAAKMKMSEIMKKIPELLMHPGTGTLVYENTPVAEILFDNHEEGLISASRQYPMDFIKANVMSQIEVILPGSAEYNNDKPIINITLARKLPNGFAWELSSGADTRGNYNAGIDAVTKINAIGIGLNYKAGMSRPPELETNTERHNLTDGSRRIDNDTNWSKGQNHNVGLNIFRSFLDNKIKVNLNARTSFNESNRYVESNSKTIDANDVITDSNESSSHTKSTNPPRFGISGSLQHIIDKSSSYSITYNYSPTFSGQTGRTETVSLAGAENNLSESSTGTKQHVINIGYAYRKKPTGKRSAPMVLASLNYINRDYRNMSEHYLYDYALNDYVEVYDRHRGLNYRQNIVNAKVLYSHDLFSRALRYSLTLNAEEVINKGTYIGKENTELDYDEFNFFPSLTVNYRIKSFSLSGGYRTSVKRPSMEQLNPYVDDTNPNHILVGNPALKGEYSHRFRTGVSKEFSIKWLNSISISYNYGFTNNAITRLSAINADNVLVTSYANIAKNKNESVSVVLSLTPVERLLITTHFTHSKNTYNLPNQTSNITRNWSVWSTAWLSLKNAPSIEISYNLAPAYSSAQTKDKTYYSTLDASCSKYFAKIRLGCSVRCSDLLNGNKKIRDTIGDDTFIQYADRQRIGRSFKLSIYWRFGKFRDPDKPENIKIDVYDMPTSQ